MSEYNPFSLEGKTILITGASSGIGKAAAIACSKMGATVIITARNEERLSETFAALEQRDGNQQIAIDLASEDGIDSLIAQIGTIDGVALCAGINETVPVQFATRQKFDKIFNVNFFVQAELLRMLTKKKKLVKDSSVVAISSVGGNFEFAPGLGIYGASKAALLSWVKSCALELAPRQIRINAVCPGVINTPMNESTNISAEDYEKEKLQYPLKRFGEPEDVAYGIIYLLSSASAWVTGPELVIAGGKVM